MLKKIKNTTEFIQDSTDQFQPQIGIILGTGLGGLVNDVNIEHEIEYEDIPSFPVSTVESHKGKLIFGELSGKKVIIMQGRFHYYEGYSLKEVAFPVQVMKFLGVKTLLISNAAGGLNSSYKKGDLMVIKDHINHFPGNPLIGENIEEIGPRFVDMYEPYANTLISKAEAAANKHEFTIQKGVYVGLPGPMLETPAEYNYLRIIGADAVGMSTVPEVIAAKHANINCFACSIITDICFGEIKPVDIQDIINTAMEAEPRLTLLFKELIYHL